ncbi:hypothetical protein B0H11DRAFT_2083460 [Mycena galericulata]|nr:hypothetical protein B0H11DRAFT_2083460 [Mycena galericulata]
MDTPFQGMLHTNTVPSDTECQRISELLAGPRKEAAGLTDEIGRLQTLLDDLTKKRDHLQDFIDAHLALLSPARRLPEDVVAEIFTHALPFNRNSILSGVEAPLLLCHICRAWRGLALATPQLWATLHIVTSSYSTREKLEQVNAAARIWLSRSGALPLSISVVISRSSRLDYDISTLLKTVILFSRRWKNMRFKCFGHHSFLPFANLSPHDVPLLETIHVEGFHALSSPTDWNTMSFLDTPRLHNVSLKTVARIFLFPLPWAQLSHLSLHHAGQYLSAEEAHKLLRQCPSLRTFSLAVGSSGPEVAESVYDKTHMEDLQQLIVVDIFQDSTGFFENLIIPNLISLEYVASADPDDIFLFTPLLVAPNRLQCLRLSIVRSTSTVKILNCLQLVPTLRELRIQREPASDLDHQFLTHLIPTAARSNSILCPELRTLQLLEFQVLSDDTLLEFIRSRTESHSINGVAQLSDVQIQFGRPMGVDIAPSLQHVIDDGFKLSLQYFDPLPSYSPSEENWEYTAQWAPWGETH